MTRGYAQAVPAHLRPFFVALLEGLPRPRCGLALNETPPLDPGMANAALF